MDALLISIVRKVNVHPCSHILKLNSLHKSPSPLGYFLMGYFLTSLSFTINKGQKMDKFLCTDVIKFDAFLPIPFVLSS